MAAQPLAGAAGVERAIDLSPFDQRFRNDATGAPAYPPGPLFKVVLAAYAHGVVSRRGIERLCRELCYNEGLTRFTLRGRHKVDGQWKVFGLVHNNEKLARLAYAA